MAVWRNRDLEDLFGGQLAEAAVTAEGIERVVRGFPAESELVDYKSRLELTKVRSNPKWNAGQERARDVSAAANGRGGILIYGVEDIGKEPDPGARMQPFVDGENPHELIDQFRKDVRQYTAPVPVFDMFAVDAPGGFYLMVVTPRSASAPHAVLAQSGDSRKALHYFVRVPGETNIRYLAEHEVAERYQVRGQSHEDRRRHSARVWEDGEEELTAKGVQVWLALAVVPDMPADALLTPAACNEIKEWEQSQSFPSSILGTRAQSMDRPFPAPGKIVYTNLVESADGEKIPGAVESYRELHADGAAYAAVMLESRSASGRVVKLDPDELLDDVCALAIHALDWVCARAGRWGNATIKVGLVSGRDPGGTPTIKLTSSGNISSHGLRRMDRRMPTATTIVDLGGLDTMQDRLRVAFAVAAPLVQSFGVAEPNWINEYGAIRPVMLLSQHRQRVVEWARRNEVGFDESFAP
ncbi:helix-turn-helix domain-containing protein [Nocardia fluminea]|uniref:AlbA family DNA-binding domain-containing protein n=1 Tax=Nocardia fluminea TaxID=134984 RepID=UPI0038241E62